MTITGSDSVQDGLDTIDVGKPHDQHELEGTNNHKHAKDVVRDFSKGSELPLDFKHLPLGSLVSSSTSHLYSSTSQLRSLPEKLTHLLDQPDLSPISSSSSSSNVDHLKVRSFLKLPSAHTSHHHQNNGNSKGIKSSEARRNSHIGFFSKQKEVLRPTKSGTDITATDHSERIDWNQLPELGSQILNHGHSLISSSIVIDGKLEQVVYDPHYNKHFRMLNIFQLMNFQNTKAESIKNGSKRLQSYLQFMSQYLKTRKYATQCYPFDMKADVAINTNEKIYESYVSGQDYSELESVISLWINHAQVTLLGSTSMFFAPAAIEHLLRRKAHLIKSKGSLHVSDEIHQRHKKKLVDIVVLRKPISRILAWQLAYDEPILNIIDCSIDFSAWTGNDVELINMIKDTDTKNHNNSTVFLSNKEQARHVNNENSGDLLVNCVGEKMKDSFTHNEFHSTHDERNSKVKNTLDSEVKDKNKHFSSSQIPSYEANHFRSHEINNQWLANYYGELLPNYSQITLPTQYILNGELQDLAKSTALAEKTTLRKNATLIRHDLKIELPFPNNSVPSMFCTDIWSEQSIDKWHVFLKEIKRCIAPGGYILAYTTDLKLADITSKEKKIFHTKTNKSTMFDILSQKAIDNKLSVYPTQHLAKAIRDAGFINVNAATLYFGSDGISSNISCAKELIQLSNWDYMLRKFISDEDSHIDLWENIPDIFDNFIKESKSTGKNETSGTKAVFIVARKSVNK